ncbi:MAG: hypothetical protein V7K92_02520 [Nostoc sp.]|uniref:hypothetical protein n=1 Tax=Nostoc sp. TaxID=1180 RepID=UPI002FF0D359
MLLDIAASAKQQLRRSHYIIGVFSAVEKNAVGNAGTIGITTNELTLKGGAQLVASSFGEENAGDITIQAMIKPPLKVGKLTSQCTS